MRFVLVVGNPKPQSRTLTVAREAADAVLDAAGQPRGYRVIDLCVLARHLLLPEPSPAVEDALEQVQGAHALLVASPTYKGTYTGLLKVFLDRLPHRGLDGVTGLPLLVMGLPAHRPSVEAHLRPLLEELGADVPVPGLAVMESDLADTGPVLRPWAAQVAPALAQANTLVEANSLALAEPNSLAKANSLALAQERRPVP
ncbi:MAG TPA: NAD(P)H-dependent oxidoreductase [Streptosporangiaceae bacterium]|jgi:FMN reductase|nr:NAD(P)H-dependent oxidoreductase [Streptosporangiaceae bacterium]